MKQKANIMRLFMIAVMAGIVTLLPLGTVSAGSGAVTEGVDPYVIGPDDTLRITVAQHPEWSGEFSVGPDGRIVISGMGEFTVGGMGKERAETALRDAMERYINNPRVSVEIVKYASQVIYVLGEVNRPGRYSTEGKVLTLRDAVILAGLPTRYAADSRVYVITPAPGKPRQQVINLYRILNRGEMRRNIALKPGDIVYVPQSILGMVNELLSILLSPLGSVNTARTVASPLP